MGIVQKQFGRLIEVAARESSTVLVRIASFAKNEFIISAEKILFFLLLNNFKETSYIYQDPSFGSSTQ